MGSNTDSKGERLRDFTLRAYKCLCESDRRESKDGCLSEAIDVSAVPYQEVEERLNDLRTVVNLAQKVMKDGEVQQWMRSPNVALGYESPLDLVAVGQHHRVLDLLFALAEGVTS